MKNAKRFLTVFVLILTCCLLLSCQALSLFEGKESDTDDVQFEEVAHDGYLFSSMTADDYHDVTDFSIGRFDGDLTQSTPIVNFSFVPLELRAPFDRSRPYHHDTEHFSGLAIDSDFVLECLENLMKLRPLRVLKPDSDQPDAVLASFSKQYGVAYSLKLTHNGQKHSVPLASSPTQTTHYDFLISPLTNDQTFFLYDRNALTLTEVNGEGLSFLKKNPEDWYSCYVFSEYIMLVDRIEIGIKAGTTHGVLGVTDLILEQYHTDKNGAFLHPLDAIEAGPDAVLHVTARYNGQTMSITDIPKYRKFYSGILWTAVGEIERNESLQEQLKNAVPEMTVNVHLKCDEHQKTLEYQFFDDNSVLFNGTYIGKLTDGQLNALIQATGLMLSRDPDDIIDLWY